MRQNFRGWNTVFGFTFRQATKGVGFKLITILISLLIIGASILFNILAAKDDKADKIKDTQINIEGSSNNSVVSPINKVYVLDNSGLEPSNYEEAISQYSMEQFMHIEFVTAPNQSREEVIKTADTGTSSF